MKDFCFDLIYLYILYSFLKKLLIMEKLFIEDLPIQGKKILMRVDFNVPLDGEGSITDATRIEAALPSIQYVLQQGGTLVLMSHLGRPKHTPSRDLSLAPVAKMLSALLNQPVPLAPSCVGHQVDQMVQNLKPGNALLLENLRFFRAEEFPDEDPHFAKKLSRYGDLYVNDAFGTAHRRHSSTYTVAQYFPNKAAAGYLLEKEMRFIGNALSNPKRPFYSLIGGAKISSKIGVLKTLLNKVDCLLIGGAMAYTFLKAQGVSIGSSFCEIELISAAKEILAIAKEKHLPLLLPLDYIIAKECSEDAETKIVDKEQGIPEGYEGFDIGPKTIRFFSDELKKAATLLWNGPVGVFECSNFSKGTESLAKAIAATSAVTIVGGGDSISALNQAGVADKISHVSTGGGATLEFIEFGTLPGIEALSDKNHSRIN